MEKAIGPPPFCRRHTTTSNVLISYGIHFVRNCMIHHLITASAFTRTLLERRRAHILRIKDGVLVEHWDIIQDEASRRATHRRVACQCSATRFRTERLREYFDVHCVRLTFAEVH